MKRRLLVIDDSPEIHKATQQVIKGGHFEVVRISSDEQTIVSTQQWQPDLTLFDMAIPGLDGCEICRHVIDYYFDCSAR